MRVELDAFNQEAWRARRKLEEIIPSAEPPIVERFRRLCLLSFSGDMHGVEKDGKHYPRPSRFQIQGALAPFIERVEAMRDPVVIVTPDPTLYDIKTLNQLDSQHSLAGYNFNDKDSVYFPSKKAVSPRWRYSSEFPYDENSQVRPLDELFQTYNGNAVALSGHQYEQPIEGWGVFVCERDCETYTLERDLASLVGPDSPYVQMTAKEAFIIRALELVNVQDDGAEIALGQFDPKKGQFPVIWQKNPLHHGKSKHCVTGASLKHTVLNRKNDKEMGLPRNQKRWPRVRKGFRLPPMWETASQICSNEVGNMQRYIAEWTQSKIGRDISPALAYDPGFDLEFDEPMDSMTVILKAVGTMQKMSRQAIQALLDIASEGQSNPQEAEQLLQELAQSRAAVTRLTEEAQSLRVENEQLRNSQHSPDNSYILNIRPEAIQHLDVRQLNKLLRDLSKYFHPDKVLGQNPEPEQKEKATRRFRELKSMIEEEIRRKESAR